MSERIALEIGGEGVAHVLLDRPDRLNALDGGMFDALLDIADRLAAMASLRAVVLSGTGPAFCAGIDLRNFERIAREGGGIDLGQRSGGTARPLPDRSFGIANGPQRAVLVWRELPVPVIAAVHGAALGGGFQLALGADLRFVAGDARLAILEVAWGLVPDMAGMLLLQHLAPADVVRDLVFSGREFSGDDALRWGLATRVCADPLSEALAWASALARQSPDAVRAAKRLLNLGADGGPAAVLLAESHEQLALLGSPNQLEAVRARRERRPGRFADPA
ncbi:MAG: crotonase/enoyl-CoA hydratase family protein [Betaproteobacteria bacterium]